jgi:protein-tyrosine phosphatase
MEAQLRVLRAEGPIVAKEVMEGVTPTSNWIVPNLILIGDVPRPNDSLEMLLDYGVECFVDVRSNASGAAACKYLAACTIEPPEHISYEGFDLGSVVTNPTTQAVGAASAFFAQVLARAFDGPGRITYVHCGDGGGLSALAGGVLLSFTYNVSALKATTVISQQYACRSAPGAPGSLFSTQLKTVAREISTQLPAAVERLMASQAAPPPSAAPQATQGQPLHSIFGDSSQRGGNQAPPPPHAGSAYSNADRFRHVHRPDDAEMNHQPPMPQPAATPNRDVRRPEMQQGGHDAQHHPGGTGGGGGQPYFTNGQQQQQQQHQPQQYQQHYQQQQQQQQQQPAQNSPVRQKPTGLSARNFEEEHQPSRAHSAFGSQPPTPVPTPTFGGATSAAHDLPSSRRGGRFAHSSGSGGGASLNLFGGGPSEADTPSRRGGRARVQNSPDKSGAAVVAAAQDFSHDGGMHHTQQQPPPASSPHGLSASSNMRPPSAGPSGASGGASGGHPSNTSSPSSNISTPFASFSIAKSVNASSANGSALPAPLDPRRAPQQVAGPTPTSNWVVAGQVCCGAKPIRSQIRPFAALAAERFNCFVCLSEVNTAPEYMDAYVNQSGCTDCVVRHVPLKDGEALRPDDVRPLMALVDEVAAQVERGAWRVYIHCERGHGRTGLFVTALLWRLYHLPAMKAVNYCDALHGCRQMTEEQSCPQTQGQRTSIVTVLGALEKQQGGGPRQ